MERSQDIATRRGVVPAQRRQLISERLRAAGSVTIAELEAEFGVSSMTARRDLQILENDGVAVRTHGGAVVPGVGRHEDSFASRLDQAPAEKERLGLAVCELVHDGQALFVDSSSTAYVALRAVLAAGRRDLTVLTNSLPAMELVARSDGQASLIGLGGSLRRVTSSFVGPQVVDGIERHFADRLLFSVTGISDGAVLTDADPLEAEVKRRMVERSQEALLLVDGTKFGRTGLSAIVNADAVTRVLAAGARKPQLDQLRSAGIEVEEVG